MTAVRLAMKEVYGTTVIGNAPFDFVNLSGGEYVVEKVELGGLHTCAMLMYQVMEARRLKCWGDNSYGQLGIGRNEYGYSYGGLEVGHKWATHYLLSILALILSR